MKFYHVKIRMVLNGNETRFTEVVEYDISPHTCINESTRERAGINQVRQRHPDAEKIEALSSISP